LSVGEAELARPTLYKTPGAEFHHQVAHGKPLAYIFLGIELTSGIQSNPTLGNDSGSQRNVCSYHKVFICSIFGNIVVGRIKTVGYHYGFYQLGIVLGQALVCNKQNWKAESFRGTKNDLFDYSRAGIGINPYFQGAVSA
jgi:hypothetical protein